MVDSGSHIEPIVNNWKGVIFVLRGGRRSELWILCPSNRLFDVNGIHARVNSFTGCSDRAVCDGFSRLGGSRQGLWRGAKV